MKTILKILILAGLIAGCISKNDQQYYNTESKSTIMSSSNFNDDAYIWENFMFPTNRTSGER